MQPNPNHQLAEWRRETEALIELTQDLLAELDAEDESRSRPTEIALDLRTRLQRRSREIITDQLTNAAAAASLFAAPQAQPSSSAATSEVKAFKKDVPPEVRAALVDPRTATCWNGAYGDEIGDQIVVSLALVWAPPDFADVVPNWAMRDAWPQLAADWDDLLEAAWERSRPFREASRASAFDDAIPF